MKEYNLNGLTITMERRSVKNMNLYVKPPDGEVLVTIPRGMNEEKALEFVRSREEWIRNAQKKIRERKKNAVVQDEVTFTPKEVEELKQNILLYAAKWEPILGVHAAKWQIREMKTRWGSCSVHTGDIRINLRLAKKPRECLEYVVVHELCHLLEPSHNARFHSLMDRFLPDWRERKRRLNA